MRRFLSLLLTAFVSITLWAESSGTCGTNVTWTLSDDSVLTISGTGAIAYNSFFNKQNIKKVVVEKGVTGVGYQSFRLCQNITSIILPDGLTSIAYEGFYYSSALTTVTLPSSLTSIGQFAFGFCDCLKTVNVSCIDNEDVTNFLARTDLADVYFSSNANISGKTYYLYENGELIKDIVLTNKATSIASGTISKFSNLYNSLTCYAGVPPTLSSSDEITNTCTIYVPDSSVTAYRVAENWRDHAGQIVGLSTKHDYSVSVEAEENRSALHMLIGEENLINVTSLKVRGTINSYDLMIMNNKMVNLRSLDISEASILANSYEYYTGVCSKDNTLTAHAIPTSLYSVKLPTNLEIIETDAFAGCNWLTEIDVPSTVTSIGAGAFTGCSALTSMTIPFVGTSKMATTASANTLFGAIFGTTSYTGGTQTLQSFGSYYMYYYIPSTLRKVNVQDGNILSAAFCNCSKLTSIILPRSLSSIGDRAFYGCSSLTALTVPETVNSIGEYAFYGCSAMTTTNIPAAVTTINLYTYYGCTKLTSTNLHDAITRIASYAFRGCSSIESVDLPLSVQTIGTYTFQNCTCLKSFVLPTNSIVSTIPTYAFSGCTSLEKMDLPVSVKTIGSYAFQNCSSMSEVKLPSSITSIGDYAFTGCSSLYDVYTYTIEPQSIDQNTFSTYTSATLHCPAVSYYDYFYDTQWSQFLKLEKFDEPYEYVYIEKDFEINTETAGTIDGDPKIDIENGGGVNVVGDNEQSFGDIHLHHHDGHCGSIYGHGDNLKGKKLHFDIEVAADKWYAFSFPYDIDLKTITKDGSWVFYSYDSDKRAGGESGWTKVSSDGTLKAGQGYIFSTNKAGTMNVEVDNPDLTARDEQTALSSHGDDNTATADRNWNFVGNRYTSYFDINELDYTAPVVTFDGSAYSAYRPGDDDLALQPFQAFFVQKPSNVDNMQFNQDGRTTYLRSQASGESKARARKAARLSQSRKLINLIVSDGENEDKTRVVFNDEQQLGYEMECDASKFISSGNMPLIYSLDSKNTRYAINERPVDDGNVRLGFIARKKGEFTISAVRMDQPVVLYDAQTGKTADLSEGSYTFESNGGTFNNRFSLKVVENETAIEAVNGEVTGTSAVSYDLSGRRVKAGQKGLQIVGQKKVMVK